MTKTLSALSVLVLAAFLLTGCNGAGKPQVGVVDAAAVSAAADAARGGAL